MIADLLRDSTVVYGSSATVRACLMAAVSRR